jgi:hypothetical protein
MTLGVEETPRESRARLYATTRERRKPKLSFHQDSKAPV